MKENMRNTKPIIWTISGADCSGGAGIAADIKTGHALGVEVCHLITANTVQNSQELVAVNAVNTEILAQQADVLFYDKLPGVIKIGLVVTVKQVDFILDLIKLLRDKQPSLKVIYDPVGSASVGGKFSDLNNIERMKIATAADIVTPNLIEAQQLSGLTDEDNSSALAFKLKGLGVKSLIVKGGHQSGEHSQDYCLHQLTEQESIVYQLTSNRVATSYSHGGGCSFASGLATYLAHGHLLRDALTLTKAFINQGLIKQQGQNGYYGAFEQPLQPAGKQFFPQITDDINVKYHDLSAFKVLGTPRGGEDKLGLYPVVDSVEWLARLMPLGLNIIQLRLKDKTEQELRHAIKAALDLSKQYNCRLFINDYWQLAIEYGAYGVHIGQEDIVDADLVKIQAAGLRLGISTHGCYEFLLAQQLRPSYLAIGAIFPTKTKDMTGQIQGVDNLIQTLRLASDIPVVAIGGINHASAETVWQTGVDSIAVVTAITEAENPEASVREFQQVISQ